MGEELFVLGAAFGSQATPGVPDPTIAALSGNLTSDDGIVLGDAESGVGESGLDLQINRRFRENAPVSGSFTRTPNSYLGLDVATFNFSFQLKGNGLGRAASPNDTEFFPVPGVDAILKACGLNGVPWAGGDGVEYIPSASANTILTAKLWGTWGSVLIYDVVGSLELAFTPGDVTIATATFAGITTENDRDGSAPFPNFDYGPATTGNQLASAPTIENVGHYWGIGNALRGFSTASITVDNETEDFPDSNAPGGVRTRATGRSINMDLTLLSDDGQSDYELAQLERDTIPTDELKFEVGGPGATGDPQVGFQIVAHTPQNMEWTPDRTGVSSSSANVLWMVGTTPNSEFSLIFL